jgi:rhodanese-related sulfurtransferase
VIDVRPVDEFDEGHLAGARNIPLAEIEAAAAQLDPETEIVAYCRGPWCVLSFDAIERLRARGFKARRLAEGYPEWKAAGLPVGQSDMASIP